MKKKLVLIVLLLLTSSFVLLAQTKTDTTASKKDAVTSPAPQVKADTAKKATDKQDKKALEKALKLAAQKRRADSLATIKALKAAVQKKQADSIAAAKAMRSSIEKNRKDSIAAAKRSISAQKANNTPVTPAQPVTIQKSNSDTSHAAKDIAQISAGQNRTDTLNTPGKPLTKRELEKLNSKKDKTDSLAANSKAKTKKRSNKELKREARKNDVNYMSEKDLSKLAFEHMSIDTTVKNPLIQHTDISYTNARPLPLTEPAPLDIKFFHRYWRDIDLQDPRNKKFSTYHADLINALLTAIRKKEIKAYSPAGGVPENPTGDAFTVPIPYEQLMAGLSDTAVVNIIDKDGNITGTKTVPNPFTPEKISGYRIKEDVYYDRIRSRSVTRIIGIAPLVKLTLSSGEVLSVQPLCWLKYKDCRKIFVTIDIDPTKKIGDTMDDIFIQRRFYGRIVQESNPEGKRIKDYKTELPDQEAEAQRIENKVTVFKKGSWNYTMLNEAPPQEPKKTKVVTKAPPKSSKKAKVSASQQ